ncbi:MAG: Abi family protein [Opitutae bacterium]|nr:Abi family protein [Opitutae bacterium]
MPLKPFKTIEDQARLIISRGCAADEKDLQEKLAHANYYRLSGYLYMFREFDPLTKQRTNRFVAGTNFQTVWRIYCSDRQFRLVLLDAIERIEISLRTKIAYEWAKSKKVGQVSNPQKHPSCYRKAFYNQRKSAKFLGGVQISYERSTDDCANHHKNDLGIRKAEDLPVWVFIELTTFSNLFSLLRLGLPKKLSEKIARDFGFADNNKFIAALSVLREARNVCAHHARAWNRAWMCANHKVDKIAPDIEEFENFAANKASTAYLTLVCHHLLGKIAPGNPWGEKLCKLLDDFSDLSEFFREHMEMTDDVLKFFRPPQQKVE